MTVARVEHTATLLEDGRVLIAGGSAGNPDNPLRSAELYDPATGTFSPVGSMTVARSGHTATLLRDGRVLVVGGFSSNMGGPQLASAELYDPATCRLSPTGSLTTARDGHTAIALVDGRVLVAGGENCGGYGSEVISCEILDSAELYDPATGRFSPAGSIGESGGTATLLNDGRVLVVGGGDGTAELYDPATGTYLLTGSPVGDGTGTAVRLQDGRVLLAGGSVGRPSESHPILAEVYEPATGTFRLTGSMTTPRIGQSVTLLPDGRVLVAGGGDACCLEVGLGHGAGLGSAELYDPATGQFVRISPMNVGRWHHTATLLHDGRVLIAGGYGEGGFGNAVASAELYTP